MSGLKMSDDAAAHVAYRRWQLAEAKARGWRTLHAPYCRCRSSWTESYRDPSCTVIS